MSITLPKDVFNEWYRSITEAVPVEIKVGGKEDLDPRNWDKPSLAVVASDGKGNGCVLFHCGPHIKEEINAVGSKLSDLGLDDCPEGIWVWEGIYRGITSPSTPNGPEEYDTKVDGKFREPKLIEWSYIKKNKCPWIEKHWMKDYKEDEKAEDMEDYEKFVCDLAKQEDKTIMAKYDLCNEQNVAALQKQEFVTSMGRNQGKTKLLDEIMEIVHCPKCNLLFDRIENKHTMNYKDVPCDFSFNRSVEHIKVDIQISSPRCECGGEKANTTHSDWCPKGGTNDQT